jgi:hypothetical protein
MGAKLRRRKGTISDKLEGGCANCCAKYCRMTPMTQALCCSAVVWFGGAFLGSGSSVCGADVTSLNIFLQNAGIVVMIMLIGSCVCCVGFVGLCCGEFPLVARVIGAICLLVAAVTALLYSGWLAYGAFALTKQPDCVTAVVYLLLMFFYLFVFIGASVVGVIWKLYDLRTGGKQSIRVNLPT